MSLVGDFIERKERPAYVRFERVAVEDKAATLKAGHYVAKDVDMALITPPYSKDIFKIKVSQWLENLKQDVANGRLPQEWADNYREAYRRWQNGQEMPLNGTAIKGWGVISPAQQETLIKINVLTVEDLAGINDEGIKRIGMGAVDLKNKAVAWLAQLQDKGPLTVKMAAVESENAALKDSVEILTRQVQELMAQVRASNSATASVQHIAPESEDISAADILDEPDQQPDVQIVAPVKRGPGRPRKVDTAPQKEQPAEKI